MKRTHLPLNALRVFEAAARHLSFTRAGAELFLSQSAVSRQIQQLEAQLGTALFVRRTRALLLTDAGQRYYRDVSQALHQLREAGAGLHEVAEGRVVTVTTSPARWFSSALRRSSSLAMLSPSIDVITSPSRIP